MHNIHINATTNSEMYEYICIGQGPSNHSCVTISHFKKEKRMGNPSNAMTSTILGDLFIKDMAIVLRRINPFIQWCDDGHWPNTYFKYTHLHT